MSVIYIDGYDMYNGSQVAIGLQSRYDVTSAATGHFLIGASANTPFTSGQSLRIVGDVQFNVGNASRFIGGSNATFCVGFHYNTANLGSYGRNNSAFFYLTQAGSTQIGLRLLSTGQLSIQRYSAVNTPTEALCTMGSTISAGQWYHLAIVGTIGNSEDIYLYVDGILEASATGVDTQNTGTAAYDGFLWRNFQQSDNISTYIDDFYITDQASFLGIRRVDTLRPSADTTDIAWTPLSGTDNYAMVNSSTVNGDTTYNFTSGVGDLDLYELSDMTSNPSVIDAVQVVCFPRKTDADVRMLKSVVESGATLSEGSAYGISSSYGHYPRLLNLNPDGDIAWTFSAVDALKVGPKLES